MRKTSEVTDVEFPLFSKQTCILAVNRNGDVDEFAHTGKFHKDWLNAIDAAIRSECTIYAIWPGRYRTDCFEVDDLESFRQKVKAAYFDAM